MFMLLWVLIAELCREWTEWMKTLGLFWWKTFKACVKEGTEVMDLAVIAYNAVYEQAE